MATQSPLIIRGFTVIRAKETAESNGGHYLFVKKMPLPDDKKSHGRTVYVANGPAWANEADFQQGFDLYGKVEKVILQRPLEQIKLPTSCEKTDKAAFVIFESKEAADKAVQTKVQALWMNAKAVEAVKARGPVAWFRHQFLVEKVGLKGTAENLAVLKKQILERIAESEEEEKEKEKAVQNEPDEEGWVTVTRVGKNKGAPRTEAEESRVKVKENRKRRRKEQTNFYSFQRREEKRQRLEELRKQFQEDKSAIEKMKKERKFRPF